MNTVPYNTCKIVSYRIAICVISSSHVYISLNLQQIKCGIYLGFDVQLDQGRGNEEGRGGRKCESEAIHVVFG